jgi:hypothetical protein
MPYTDPLDPATPIAAEAASQGDDRIRALKLAINERMADLVNGWPAGPLSLKIPNLYLITAMLADLVVTTAKLADNSVTAEKIADGAVGTIELADQAVTGDKVAANAIDTGMVKLLAITDALIASVDGSKIVDASIDGATKLLDGSVTAAKLSGLLADFIADGSIVNAKIADATLEIAKLSVAAKDLIAIKKGIAIHVGGGAHGSDTVSLAAQGAFLGAALRNHVQVGYPDMTTWAAGDRTNTWMAFVDVVDHVMLMVQNNTGGAKNWPVSDFELFITKSATDWGL